MKTGFGLVENKPNEELKEKIGSMMLVLMEKAVLSAAHYMKQAGRTTLTALDMKYGFIYEAHEFLERDDIEQRFEEVHYRQDGEDESESEDECQEMESEGLSDETEEIEEVEEEFTRATTDDETIVKMNKYFDEWDDWNPDDRLQQGLKDAINKMSV